MHTTEVAQRRARLGVRHHLAAKARASTVVDAVSGVVALHSTDPASVFLSLRARTSTTAERIEEALYRDRILLRMLGMRRTMFVVPTGFAPVLQESCTRAIAEQQRKRYAQLVEQAGVGDAAMLAELSRDALAALRQRGDATGVQLSTDVPRLRTPVTMQGGTQNLTTWVLFQLAADGEIVRGRPRGSWTSSQYHWSPVDRWLPAGLHQIAPADARVELVRRWLHAFGPGSAADIKWWTGWTMGQVRTALAAIGPSEVDSGLLVLPGDEEPVPPSGNWVALLPALDPTPMGWAERSWYVGEHAAALFDRSGNIGPTVWCDGRIVGGWAQRADGRVVYRLLEDIGAAATKKVATEADRLTDWIGPVRVTPRFRTPLERDLSS